jgi:hypothetical protein
MIATIRCSRLILVAVDNYTDLQVSVEWSTRLVLYGGYTSKYIDHMESLFHMVYMFQCPQGGALDTDNPKLRGGGR